MTPAGKGAEQITHHGTLVSHPVLLSDTTLMYLANVGDGNGPRLHSMDLRDRVPHVLGTSLDRYTSLAASGDGQRLVATRANPKGTLWRLPLADASAPPAAMNRLSLPTGRGFAPRLGPGYLLYASQKGDGEASGSSPMTLPRVVERGGARIIGGPELSPDGLRIAFSVEQRGKFVLYAMNADSTDLRVVTDAVQLRGAPAWAPDGQSIVSGATINGVSHLVRVPLAGPPVPVHRGLRDRSGLVAARRIHRLFRRRHRHRVSREGEHRRWPAASDAAPDVDARRQASPLS